MAFSYTGSVNNTGTSSLVPITHGLTINEGDLVVAIANHNNSGTFTANSDTGAAWNNPVNEIPSGETTRFSLWWKTANSTEPTTPEWTAGGSSTWQVVFLVFSSDNTFVLDAAANTHIQTTNSTDLVCGAYGGQVIAANAVAIVAGGKDNRASTTEVYTVADNSYGNTVGESGSQSLAAAHRIYTTGETGSGNITIQTTDGSDGRSDKTFSTHISFVETGVLSGNLAGSLSLLGTGL